MRALSAIALATVLLAGGCTSSSRMTTAVDAFSKETLKALELHRRQLAFYTTEATDDFANDLADERAVLTITTGCVTAVDDPQSLAECRVEKRGGGKVEFVFQPANVIALSAALQDYVAQLGRLAASSKQDTDAFGAAVRAVASSVASLDGATASLVKTPPVTSKAQLDAVANIVAEVGSIYLASQRVTALRKIIVASNDIVVEAAEQLAKVDDLLGEYASIAALEDLNAAENDLRAAVASGASKAVVREKQQLMLRNFNAFREKVAVQSGFLALGRAHDELAQAARSGASVEDMLAFTKELMNAARAVGQSIPALSNPS
jgi:hypothetical protein